MKRYTNKEREKAFDALHDAVSEAAKMAKNEEFIKASSHGNPAGKYPDSLSKIAIGPRRDTSDRGGLNSVITHHPNAWTKPPETEEDKAILEGWHVHTSNGEHSKGNPYGLHQHSKSGKLSGAHMHGPANPQGKHTHKADIDMTTENINKPISISGAHKHENPFLADGGHWHVLEDYGNS